MAAACGKSHDLLSAVRSLSERGYTGGAISDLTAHYHSNLTRQRLMLLYSESRHDGLAVSAVLYSERCHGATVGAAPFCHG